MKNNIKRNLFMFSLLGILLTVFLGIQTVFAASVNTKSVNLYYLTDSYKQYLTKPSNFQESFQIVVSGAKGSPTYKVKSGESASVSASGLITMKTETWYCSGGFCTTAPTAGYTKRIDYIPGKSVITVTVDNQTFDITVEVTDYADYNARKIMDDYLAKNITSGMTQYQKMDKIAALVATKDYSTASSSYVGLFSGPGGDCWASTSAILYMAEKVGIVAWDRDGRQDGGAGGGHRNVAAILDGKVYVVEAGYSGKAPRPHYLFASENGFTTDNVKTYIHYDGIDKVANVPTNVNVPILGELAFFRGYNKHTVVTTVNVPNTITTIEQGAFAGVRTITTINVAADNPNYKSENNVVYDKNKTVLVAYPSGKADTSFSIPTGIKEIFGYAFAYNTNLNSVTIPSTVTKIGDCAFCSSGLLDVVIGENVTSVGENAFYGSALKYILFKNKNTTISNYAIGRNVVIAGYKGSTAETYAKANNNTFVAIDGMSGEPKFITEKMISGLEAKTWTGSAIKPNLVIKDGNYTLKENVDYTLTLSNNVNVGTASVVINGKGNYIGGIKLNFEIKAKKINYKITNTVVGVNDSRKLPTFEFEDKTNFTILYQSPTSSNVYTSDPYWIGRVGNYDLNYKISATGYETVTGKVTLTVVDNNITENHLVYNGIDYSSVFNFKYYTNKYSDIKANYGNNVAGALIHFVNYGMKEGRQASENFNVMYYKANNEDLANLYKDNLASYYDHYIKYGKKENRNAKTLSFNYKRKGMDFSKIFNLDYYIQNNKDVANAYNNKIYGYDYYKIFEHFYNYGMAEGRNSISSFNPMYYKANYVDLYNLYKDNTAEYYLHYAKYGASEKRNAQTLKFAYNRYGYNFAKIFDIDYYMKNNPDVVKAYNSGRGVDYVKVFEHFYKYGMAEARKSISSFNPMYYKANYVDLYNLYKDNTAEYYLHYARYGANEKRNAQTLKFEYNRYGYNFSKIIDVAYYAEINKDVAKIYNTHQGLDYTSMFEHFYKNGMAEGRKSIKTFDVVYYKKNNSDLSKAYGNNLKQYYLHYLNYGIKEGRKGIA